MKKEMYFLLYAEHDGEAEYYGRTLPDSPSKGRWQCSADALDENEPYKALMARRFGWKLLAYAKIAMDDMQAEHPDWHIDLSVINL